LTDLANSYYDLGDLAGAKRFYEQALETSHQIGNQLGVAGALDSIASVLGDMGDPAGARKLSEQALKIYREMGDLTGMGETLDNIAAEQILEGDFSAATKTSQQALERWRNLGDMLLAQGELTRAKASYEEALSTFRESGQKGQTAYPLAGLAGVLSAEGN